MLLPVKVVAVSGLLSFAVVSSVIVFLPFNVGSEAAVVLPFKVVIIIVLFPYTDVVPATVVLLYLEVIVVVVGVSLAFNTVAVAAVVVLFPFDAEIVSFLL